MRQACMSGGPALQSHVKPPCWSVSCDSCPQGTVWGTQNGQGHSTAFSSGPPIATVYLQSAEAAAEGPSCLFQLLGTPGIPRPVAASLPSLPSSSRGFSSVSVISPHLIRTQSHRMRATPMPLS